jgi:quinoprotein glucose dehydrogenase
MSAYVKILHSLARAHTNCEDCKRNSWLNVLFVSLKILGALGCAVGHWWSSELPKLRKVMWLLMPGITAWGAVWASAFSTAEYVASDDWAYYNGDPGGTHYSRLKDINTRNVSKLSVAWTHDTGDVLVRSTPASSPAGAFTMESNPLIVRGRLFFMSPKGRLICLDGETGRDLWAFDLRPYWRERFRGVSYWTDGKEHRILFASGADIHAIDADTGRPAVDFGSAGHVHLATRIPLSSTPGAVYKDLIIVGGAGSIIRAFDVRTGHLRWTFHTIPQPGETGYETWPKDAWKRSRGVNAWSGMTLDAARGLVFVPLGEAFDTSYGVDRAGDNLFSDSLVALNAETGRLVWYFQTVRHDLWDRDLPAPPTLVSVVHDGKRVDALAQITKSGFVYVLDRVTGKSLFPIVEKSVLHSDIPGEVSANSQIEPQSPAPFARQLVTADLLTRRTPQAAAAVAAQFSTLRSRGAWDPPSEQGTILFPGCDGGGEWGGAAFDPETGLLYVNSNEIAWILKLKKSSLTAANGDTQEADTSVTASSGGVRYGLDTPRFLDPDGYPAISPPWGTLSAIDLNTGQYAWKIPFGEYPELAAEGMKNTGSENYGGAIVTAGGLLFIGATSFDRKFRAYNKRTGELLWETVLPAAGNATPATYRVNGRQFVVIAAGGGRPPKTQSGSTVIAFALKQ